MDVHRNGQVDPAANRHFPDSQTLLLAVAVMTRTINAQTGTADALALTDAIVAIGLSGDI